MTPNKYKNISKDELYLISRSNYEKQKLITTRFVQKLFPDKNKASRVLSSLIRKGRLLRIEKGKYFLVPIDAPNQEWAPNEYVAASLWMGDAPYYVGYFSMYNYWGFTEQIPQTMFILNTAKSRTRLIGNIRYKAVKIDKRKFYGIDKVNIGGEPVYISDKERTLVDFIYNPIGSFETMERAIADNLKKIDLNKFIKYLAMFPVAAVRKRAGYILEKLGCSKDMLEKLKKSIDKNNTYVVLNPSRNSRKGKVNTEWRVIVNR